METKILFFRKKLVANKVGKIFKDKKLNFKLGATLLIQRLFRKRRARREYLKHLEFKNLFKNQNKIKQFQITPKEMQDKRKKAAATIWKAWLLFKKSSKLRKIASAQLVMKH
jgi:hypothetical protein